MYTSIANIIEAGLSESTLIMLLNDEERQEADIDLEDAADLIVIRANKLIVKSDALIDSFLRGRYTLPLTEPYPETIIKLSEDISIFHFYQHRHRTNMPEDIVTNFKDNVKLLNAFQSGSSNPGIDTVSKSSVQIKTNQSTKEKTFTDDLLENY